MKKYIQTTNGVLKLTPSKKYVGLSNNRLALTSDLVKTLKKIKENNYDAYINYPTVRVYDKEKKMRLEDEFNVEAGENSWGRKYIYIGCKRFYKKEVESCIKYFRLNKIKI